MKIVHLAVFCLGTGLGLATAVQAQQTQQFGTQQMMRQQPGQQQLPGQVQGDQQLTEQSIHNFFQQAESVLQQTARTQDPEALRQYLSQYLAPDAQFTSISQLYLRDRHIATTVSEATDEMVTDALGYAATALQGRKLVSDYTISIDVEDIDISPSQDTARVETSIQERGMLIGPVAQRVAQARERMGELRQQRGQGQQMGQLGQRLQEQRWGRMQSDQPQGGMGMGTGPGRGGAPEQQGIQFQTWAECTHDLSLQRGQIKLGNTFCRSTTRIGG